MEFYFPEVLATSYIMESISKGERIYAHSSAHYYFTKSETPLIQITKYFLDNNTTAKYLQYWNDGVNSIQRFTSIHGIRKKHIEGNPYRLEYWLMRLSEIVYIATS